MPEVQNTVQEDRNLELTRQISKLEGIVIEGFKGVHSRQDIANGRTAKLEGRVAFLETTKAKDEGRRSGISISWGVFIALAGIVIGVLTILAHI